MIGGYWVVVKRDRRGYPIELRRVENVERIWAEGQVIGYRSGSDIYHPDDVYHLNGGKVTDV